MNGRTRLDCTLPRYVQYICRYVHGARQTDILTRQTRKARPLFGMCPGGGGTLKHQRLVQAPSLESPKGFCSINSPKPDNRKSTKLHGKLAMHQHKRQGTNRCNSRIRAAKPRLYFLCRCHWAGFNIGTGLRDGSKAQRRSARHLRYLGSSPFRAAGRCDPIRRLET